MKLGLRPLTRPRLRSSVLFSRFLFRPKRRLNGTGLFVLEVGEDAGPDAGSALQGQETDLWPPDLCFSRS